MDATDRAQQEQIEGLERREKLMFWILILGAVANIAQIIECYVIWKTR